MGLARVIVQQDEPAPERKPRPVSTVPVQNHESSAAHKLAALERDYAALQLALTNALTQQGIMETRLRELRDVVATPQQREEINAIESGNALIHRIAKQEGITIESVRQALAGTQTRQQVNRFSPVREWAQARAAGQNRNVYGREPLTTDEPLLTWLSTPDATGNTPYHQIRTVRGDAWRGLIRHWKALRPYCK